MSVLPLLVFDGPYDIRVFLGGVEGWAMQENMEKQEYVHSLRLACLRG